MSLCYYRHLTILIWFLIAKNSNVNYCATFDYTTSASITLSYYQWQIYTHTQPEICAKYNVHKYMCSTCIKKIEIKCFQCSNDSKEKKRARSHTPASQQIPWRRRRRRKWFSDEISTMTHRSGAAHSSGDFAHSTSSLFIKSSTWGRSLAPHLSIFLFNLSQKIFWSGQKPSWSPTTLRMQEMHWCWGSAGLIGL